MLIIRDCVSKNICNLCNKEIDSFLEKRVWSLSDTTWRPDLQEGIPGTCAASPPSRLVEIKVRSAVKKYLPDLPREQIVLNYHYWLKYSGVNWHEDKKYIFGATLYLNEWDKKWGGLFLWQDKKDGEIHGLVPKPGTLVINNDAEDHMVTQISPLAKYPRRAIQLWGMKK